MVLHNVGMGDDHFDIFQFFSGKKAKFPGFLADFQDCALIQFQGEHYLNGQVLGTVVMPLVEKLLFGE